MSGERSRVMDTGFEDVRSELSTIVPKCTERGSKKATNKRWCENINRKRERVRRGERVHARVHL